MVEELAQRKLLLEAALKEAEVTMTGAEKAVANKTKEIKTLVSVCACMRACACVCVRACVCVYCVCIMT